ncbi:phage protein [Streptococcus dysgalactiae subsp. dysgalactiae]|uniref:Phage protein n=1 Tax=Streptococcus dysgalactiae subsp. dysgalactiae TaxID=99822 RepID=A0A380JWC5_STRDY|nr:YopX family protein [Streptococcus dysgalactiae]SUN50774.1 phage protein [Streptococcus dysgalactiae subsp. dysgalactiae]
MILKYRAFNKKAKKMYGVDGFKSSERKIYRCSLADDEFRSGRLETFHFVEDNLDDYILMQSTGLFDKNGVEVFDGDVVNAYDTDRDDGQIYKTTNLIGVVTYHENAFCLKQGNVLTDLWVHSEEFEVIGNIYQNSDLLESVEE